MLKCRKCNFPKQKVELIDFDSWGRLIFLKSYNICLNCNQKFLESIDINKIPPSQETPIQVQLGKASILEMIEKNDPD